MSILIVVVVVVVVVVVAVCYGCCWFCCRSCCCYCCCLFVVVLMCVVVCSLLYVWYMCMGPSSALTTVQSCTGKGHLWVCLTCGVVGCCPNAPPTSKHISQHVKYNNTHRVVCKVAINEGDIVMLI